MAPRGATNRGARHSSTTRGRGGIHKQKAPNLRTDKDGDAVMGSTPSVAAGAIKGSRARGAGRSAGRPRAAIGSQESQRAIIRGLDAKQANIAEGRVSRSSPPVRLVIKGLRDSKAALNPDGGLKNLLGFLERKAAGMEPKLPRSVRINKKFVVVEGVNTILTVSQEESEKLLKLNGFTFAGATLHIEVLDCAAPPSAGQVPTISKEAKETEEQIRAILSKRYDIQLKLLNLSALGKDEDLRSMGIFDAKNRITKLFPVLMAICDKLFATAQQKRDAIISITLTDNELDGTSAITTLAQTFPDIKNLDLSRNKFSDVKDLSGWRWKFRKLELLQITDNPIESTQGWKEEIARWFPVLQVLNNEQIRSPEEAALILTRERQAKEAAQILPIPVSGPDFRDVNQIGQLFLRQFFKLYDSDRQTLADSYYDADSSVTLSINMSSPRSRSHNVPIAPWIAYLQHSRNLVKITNITTRMSRAYQGQDSVKKLWSSLPATTHPNITQDISRYVVDCHPIAGLRDSTGQNTRDLAGLLLLVHGEFAEAASPEAEPSLRSFSRTFILGPGSGSMPIRVCNDSLILRAWNPLPSVAPTVHPTEAALLSGGPPVLPAGDGMLQMLMEQTGMTAEYATLCMDGTGWDLARAYDAFIENRASLPANAFKNTDPR